ncbi:hypothetical protein ES703_104120 [subsurface metagenome]
MDLTPDGSVTVREEVNMTNACGCICKGRQERYYLGAPHNGFHGPLNVEAVNNFKGVFGYIVRNPLVPSCAPRVKVYGENYVAGVFEGLSKLGVIIQTSFCLFQ